MSKIFIFISLILVILNLDLNEEINIKQKEKKEINGKGLYNFMFSIDEIEMIQKGGSITYNELKDLEKFENGVSKAILKENVQYEFPNYEEDKNVNVVYQSCGESLNQIQIFNGNETYKNIDNKETGQKYQLNDIEFKTTLNLKVSISFKKTNKYLDIEDKLKGAIIGFSDQIITQDDINKYNSMKLNISQEGKKIIWDVLENTTQYDIFVLNENNSYVQYLTNPCFLQSIKNNDTKLNKNEESYIKYYWTQSNEITLEEKGKYKVAVASNVTQKIPMVYIYNITTYDSSLAPDDDGGMSTGTLIFMVIAVPVVLLIAILLLILLIKAGKNSKIDQLLGNGSKLDNN